MPEPESLAQVLAPGGSCPIPATHDRLQECHYWWHEMARNYHEPSPFRYSLGAFLQAARSVTLMLQAEKRAFSDLNWYKEWASGENGQALSWVNDNRVSHFHQAALDTNSWMELRCLDAEGEVAQSSVFRVNPFICTHSSIRESDAIVSSEDENHDHEFVRHWELNDLRDQELLEACSKAYAILSSLLDRAHAEAGSKTKQNYPGSVPPCMLETSLHRTARVDQSKTWIDQPPGLHEHA